MYYSITVFSLGLCFYKKVYWIFIIQQIPINKGLIGVQNVCDNILHKLNREYRSQDNAKACF